jgi:hypothetical protein
LTSKKLLGGRLDSMVATLHVVVDAVAPLPPHAGLAVATNGLGDKLDLRRKESWRFYLSSRLEMENDKKRL